MGATSDIHFLENREENSGNIERTFEKILKTCIFLKIERFYSDQQERLHTQEQILAENHWKSWFSPKLFGVLVGYKNVHT